MNENNKNEIINGMGLNMSGYKPIDKNEVIEEYVPQFGKLANYNDLLTDKVKELKLKIATEKLKEFCKKYNIQGFDPGSIPPDEALEMLKKRLNIIDEDIDTSIKLNNSKQILYG